MAVYWASAKKLMIVNMYTYVVINDFNFSAEIDTYPSPVYSATVRWKHV